jgi:hypothetical protein
MMAATAEAWTTAWTAAPERTAALAAVAAAGSDPAAALRGGAAHALSFHRRQASSGTAAAAAASAAAAAATAAEASKAEGNRHYERGDHARAAHAYTEVRPSGLFCCLSPCAVGADKCVSVGRQAARLAVRTGGGRGPTPAVCLANRSAALAALSQWADAVRDVDAAVAAGYPAAGRTRLLRRRALALAALGRSADARAAWAAAVQAAAADDRMDLAQRTALKDEAAQALAALASASAPAPDDVSASTTTTTTEASAAVEERHAAGPYGRYLAVAGAASLSPGTLVLAERPAALVVVPPTSACSRCMRVTPWLLPCLGCGVVLYCDDVCRAADAGVHGAECPVAALREGRGWGASCALALRAAHVDGVDALSSPWAQLPAAALVDGPLVMAAWVSVTADPTPFTDASAPAAHVAALVVRTVAMRCVDRRGGSHCCCCCWCGMLTMGETLWVGRVNAFAVQTTDGVGDALGLGLYVRAARLNHACAPNCLARSVCAWT